MSSVQRQHLSVFFAFALLVHLLHHPTAVAPWVGLLTAVYLLFSLRFLHRTNPYRARATRWYTHLLDPYRWQGEALVYMLAQPESYRGIRLLRRYKDWHRARCSELEYVNNDTVHGRV